MITLFAFRQGMDFAETVPVHIWNTSGNASVSLPGAWGQGVCKQEKQLCHLWQEGCWLKVYLQVFWEGLLAHEQAAVLSETESEIRDHELCLFHHHVPEEDIML